MANMPTDVNVKPMRPANASAFVGLAHDYAGRGLGCQRQRGCSDPMRDGDGVFPVFVADGRQSRPVG